MNAIIFDTETNGKPLRYNASMTEVDNWPRVTQLAWQKVNLLTGDTLNEYQSLITPDGWTIPTVEEQITKGEKNPNFFVENNMSTERCQEEGRPIGEVLYFLIEDMNDSLIIVAHNMSFDLNVVAAEMIRIQVKANRVLLKICTMDASTEFCALPGKYGYKWPKLIELHDKLFGEEFKGAHDALFDVRACTKCLLELIRLEVIKIQLPETNVI